jgi:hypothetical protein
MRTDGPWEVGDTAAVAQRMRSLREQAGPFDIAVPGESNGADPGRADLHARHAEAGATWWIEAIHQWREDLPDDVPWPVAARRRIDAGP